MSAESCGGAQCAAEEIQQFVAELTKRLLCEAHGLNPDFVKLALHLLVEVDKKCEGIITAAVEGWY